MTRTSLILNDIQPSVTLAVTDKARALREKGKKVYAFAAGEPDFNPPEFIGDAAQAAFEAGYSKYTATVGIPDLREAIVRDVQRRKGWSYEVGDVLVSGGAKMVLYLAMQALLDPGDEVLIPRPYWVSYPEQVRLQRAVPVFLPCDGNFSIDPQVLEDHITEKTKLLILNSPSNPSGKVLGRDELAGWLDVLRRHPQVHVISDEIYDRLVYDGRECLSPVDVAPDLAERCMVVNGVSKSYAMTGWRIGWGLGPRDWIKGMGKLQGQMLSNPTSIAQHAAMAALNGPQEFFEDWLAQYTQRRNRMHERLVALDGVSCRLPEGAFYLFADVRPVIERLGASKKLNDDVDFAGYLLDAAGVASVPGTAFGMPGYLRFSFACSMEDIEEGMDRLEDAVKG